MSQICYWPPIYVQRANAFVCVSSSTKNRKMLQRSRSVLCHVPASGVIFYFKLWPLLAEDKLLSFFSLTLLTRTHWAMMRRRASNVLWPLLQLPTLFSWHHGPAARPSVVTECWSSRQSMSRCNGSELELVLELAVTSSVSKVAAAAVPHSLVVTRVFLQQTQPQCCPVSGTFWIGCIQYVLALNVRGGSTKFLGS